MKRAVLAVAGLAVALTACSSGGRRGEPLVGPLPVDDPKVALGQVVFNRNCEGCHPGGEAGLGPMLNSFPAPGFLIKFQVRRGLGAMPAFPPTVIAGGDLDAIVAYMMAMRHHG